jgi:hypothetical protein
MQRLRGVKPHIDHINMIQDSYKQKQHTKFSASPQWNRITADYTSIVSCLLKKVSFTLNFTPQKNCSVQLKKQSLFNRVQPAKIIETFDYISCRLNSKC